MTRLFVASAIAVGLTLSAGPAPGQEKKNTDQAGQKDQKAKVQSVHRLSHVVGTDVRDPKGKDLGAIEDLVFELKSGEIRYAALSFGGFASVGDKLFAVPWQELTFKFGEDESYFILDITEEKLKRAPGFDQDKWPDTADPEWSKTIDAYYGNKDASATKRTKDPVKPGELIYDAVYRGDNITGAAVKNDEGKDLGTIHELVIDVEQAKIRYAALSFGGVLGLGDKLFAIPWKALAFKHEGTDRHFVLNVTPEMLKKAEGFDEDRWPNVGDPRWAQGIDEFYGEGTREAAVPKRAK